MSARTDDERSKLVKLVAIWEKHSLFPTATIDLLRRDVTSALANYERSVQTEHADKINALSRSFDEQVGILFDNSNTSACFHPDHFPFRFTYLPNPAQYAQMERQHQEYVNHLTKHVHVLDETIDRIDKQLQQTRAVMVFLKIDMFIKQIHFHS